MTYEEIRPPNYVPEDEQRKRDLKAEEKKEFKRSLGIVAAVAVGAAALGGFLNEGKKKDEERRARIEQLRQQLAEEPEIPFAISMKPDDPERTTKEKLLRRRADMEAELADLKRIIPDEIPDKK